MIKLNYSIYPIDYQQFEKWTVDWIIGIAQELQM